MYCHQCNSSGCFHAQMGMAGMSGLANQMQSQAAYYDAIAGIQNVQSRVIEKEQEQKRQRKKLLLLRA